MNKKTKKNNTTKDMVSEIKEEFKRHTGVLMEQMRQEVKTVAEGHAAIMRKLGEHDKRFDSHDKRFDNHDKKITGMDQRLTRVEMVATDINGRLKAVEKKLDESLNNHETRITKLEEKIHA